MDAISASAMAFSRSSCRSKRMQHGGLKRRLYRLADRGTGSCGNVIRIDDERVRDHLGRIVRGTVEETLNAMLEAEADRLCNAGRYERTEARRDQRSGSYD